VATASPTAGESRPSDFRLKSLLLEQAMASVRASPKTRRLIAARRRRCLDTTQAELPDIIALSTLRL
jgi:hypothetical protein